MVSFLFIRSGALPRNHSGKLTQQHSRPCAREMYVGIAAHQGSVCRELHRQVVVQTAGEGALIAAEALYQYLHSLTNLRLDQRHGDLVLQLEQAGHAVGLFLAGGGVRHIGGLGAGALGIDR